ncbi:MAG: NAD-binding protein [Hyphomonadaceae bacterium]
MRRPGVGRYGNVWSRLAAGFTASAHVRAPAFRWAVLVTLFLIWAVAGYLGWIAHVDEPGGPNETPVPLGMREALYRTLGALSMQDVYVSPDNSLLEIARFAGLAIPLVGLLFAFSGALGRSLSQACNRGAARHVVIAGASAEAISLAQDCVRRRDSVILIGRAIPEETAWSLGEQGVTIIAGDASRVETLRDARAHYAAHVVAFESDDSANLQIEAVMRRLVGARRRRRPIAVHVATRSPVLLQEAREMRSLEQSKRDAAERAAKEAGQPPPPPASIDPKPFSLDELAARALVQQEAGTILSIAAARGHKRPHIVIFGFDEAAEAVAVRALMSLWSARFEAPRVTICTTNEAHAAARFRARYPQASAYPELWRADIEFLPFDWVTTKVDTSLLEEIARVREPAAAIVVSTGSESENILLSLALKRACNQGYVWPVPIFMKETSQSEFSRQYAKGDDTPDIDDAYLQAFGAHQIVATRPYVLDGRLDMGAAIAHRHYVMGLGERDHATMKDLQAAARGWGEVMETYRSANRAVADSALVKIWDAGWRPAERAERDAAGVTNDPDIPEDMMLAMAKREHDRWMAERLLNGWRPGEKRNNELRVHPNLKGWDTLTPDEKDRDVVQVKAAINIGRMMHRPGFMRRGEGSTQQARAEENA